jgi:hypothetical protein
LKNAFYLIRKYWENVLMENKEDKKLLTDKEMKYVGRRTGST